jgi:hypothetical protein
MPSAIALYEGDATAGPQLIISDYANHCIRSMNLRSEQVTTMVKWVKWLSALLTSCRWPPQSGTKALHAGCQPPALRGTGTALHRGDVGSGGGEEPYGN